MKYSHILWDWNGTLLNDVDCAVASVNDILVQNGLPATDFDTYVQTMEYPLEVYYRKLMGDYDYRAVMEQFQQGVEEIQGLFISHLIDRLTVSRFYHFQIPA